MNIKQSVNLRTKSKKFALLKTGKWTPEEDSALQKIVELNGSFQWKKIAALLGTRNAIQCLHRWMKILKPGLKKGPWTYEEDKKLLEWVEKNGAKDWSFCSRYIKGRTGKQCRERWFFSLNPEVKKGNWSKKEDFFIFKLCSIFGSKWSKIASFVSGRTENAIKNRFYSTLRRFAMQKSQKKSKSVKDLREYFPDALKEKQQLFLNEMSQENLKEITPSVNFQSAKKNANRNLSNLLFMDLFIKETSLQIPMSSTEYSISEDNNFVSMIEKHNINLNLQMQSVMSEIKQLSEGYSYMPNEMQKQTN